MTKGPEPRVFALARILLGIMLCWAPLPFGSVHTWAWASLSLLTLVILMLWMFGSLQRGTLAIGYTPVYLPLVGFLVLGMIQLSLHLTLAPTATKESLLKLATYFVLFFVVMQLFVDSPIETWRRVGLAVLTFGFIFSFLSVLQFFWNPARILWVNHDITSPFGPYVDHDHYAGLMELVIPVSAAYVLSRPKRGPLNGLLWFCTLVPVVSLLLTGSRGGLVSVLFEIVMLGSITLWRNPLPSRRLRVVAAGLALGGALALFIWLVPEYVRTKLGTANNYVSAAGQGGRMALWEDTLRIVEERPLIGTGLGSFVTAYPSYQSYRQDLITEHAHNDYIEALSETGLAGGLLILAALFLSLRFTFTNLKLQLRYESGWIQMGGTVACCGLLIHTLVDFNLHIPANAIWFAFCAGLAMLSGQLSSHRRNSAI